MILKGICELATNVVSNAFKSQKYSFILSLVVYSNIWTNALTETDRLSLTSIPAQGDMILMEFW